MCVEKQKTKRKSFCRESIVVDYIKLIRCNYNSNEYVTKTSNIPHFNNQTCQQLSCRKQDDRSSGCQSVVYYPIRFQVSPVLSILFDAYILVTVISLFNCFIGQATERKTETLPFLIHFLY